MRSKRTMAMRVGIGGDALRASCWPLLFSLSPPQTRCEPQSARNLQRVQRRNSQPASTTYKAGEPLSSSFHGLRHLG